MGMTARGLCNSNIVQRKMMQVKHMVWGLVSVAVISIVGCGGSPKKPIEKSEMAEISPTTKTSIAESLKKIYDSSQKDGSFLKKAMSEFDKILDRTSIYGILNRESNIIMENISIKCLKSGEIILNVSKDYTGDADFRECKDDTVVFNGKIEVLQNDENVSQDWAIQEIKSEGFSAKLNDDNMLNLSQVYLLEIPDEKAEIKLGKSSIVLDGEKIDFEMEKFLVIMEDNNNTNIDVDKYKLTGLLFRNEKLGSWIKIETIEDIKLKNEHIYNLNINTHTDRDSVTEGKLEISGSDESKVTFEIKDENELVYTGVDNETQNYDINLSDLDNLLDQLKN